VWLSRSQAVAQSLLGYDFKGILTSDRYGAYNWLEVASRQVCWAHLKRDFIQIAERTGASAELGTALLEQQKHLFALWYQDGTLSRPDLIAAVVRIRARVHELCMKQPVTRSLHRRKRRGQKQCEPVNCCNWNQRCGYLSRLKVEPTNNAAERAIRPAVLWRRTSFGAQSQAGSVFVARMLTVVTTLHSQNRNVLEYLSQACQAARRQICSIVA